MVDVSFAEEADATTAGAGLFSRLARTQYSALAGMRANLFVNAIRSSAGAIEFSARAVSFTIYSFIGVSMGIGAGAAMFSLLSAHEWRFVPIEFWIVMLLWQAISIALASFQEHFDLAGLLRFPVSFGSLLLLQLIFGLIDIPTIVGGLCSLGVFVGATLAQPHLVIWIALVVACFAAFNMFLARAILAWLDRWLAKRRSREIMSGVFLLAVLSLQAFNPAFHKQMGDDVSRHTEAYRLQHGAHTVIDAVEAVQAWLPPGLGAGTLQHAGNRNPIAALGLLGLLGGYGVGAGALLALRVRAEYRGESLDEAPERRRAATRETGWLPFGGPIVAVIEKELRTLTRSIPQLYALAVPTLMVFVIGNVFHTTASGTGHPFQLAFPVCVAYGLLGFIQLIYNNLGAEGRGIQLLLLSPTRIRTVLLAKNLFHAFLFMVCAVVSGLLASFRLGRPDSVVVVTTVAWLAFALPANLAAGNIMSLTMPYRVNLGRIGRQAGSQANALFSMLIQAVLLGVGVGTISLCAFFGRMWLAALVLGVLAVGACLAWVIVLSKTDQLAASRRDQLLSRLARTE
jgi:ABC-2 type transport system permease protein